jgi:hypothetical protein
MSPHLARLPDGKGGIRPVLITTYGGLVDPETGASLGEMPISAGNPPNPKDYWKAGFVSSLGSRIYKGSGGDWATPPLCFWAMTVEGTQVRPDAGTVAAAGSDQGPFALSDRALLLNRGILDPATGAFLYTPKNKELFPVPTIAGKYLITARDGLGCGDTNSKRADLAAMKVFNVYDISDPANPKLVQSGNLLGGPELPCDIADKHVPEFAKREFKRCGLGCYQGINGSFGVRTSGVTAHGSRLYIKSNTHLYCIGEK